MKPLKHLLLYYAAYLTWKSGRYLRDLGWRLDQRLRISEEKLRRVDEGQ